MTSRREMIALASGLVATAVVPAHASAAGLKFELYRDARAEFRWRLKAGNGRVLATSSEGYKTKAACRGGIDLIREEAAAAAVTDLS